MDARVKTAHDESKIGAAGITCAATHSYAAFNTIHEFMNS